MVCYKCTAKSQTSYLKQNFVEWKKHVFAFKTSIKHTNFLQIILLMFSELFTSGVCVTKKLKETLKGTVFRVQINTGIKSFQKDQWSNRRH